MGIAATLKHVQLLLVALTVLTVCTARHQRERDPIVTCPPGLYACHTGVDTGFFRVSCIPRPRLCDGRDDCPFGDDEMDCPSTSTMTSTSFTTSTSSTTVTASVTTTTTTTTTMSTTTMSTSTFTSISSKKLTAIVPFAATSATSTTTSTSTISYTALVPINDADSMYDNADLPCRIAAVPAGGAMIGTNTVAFLIVTGTPVVSIVPVASATCMPSTTIYH